MKILHERRFHHFPQRFNKCWIETLTLNWFWKELWRKDDQVFPINNHNQLSIGFFKVLLQSDSFFQHNHIGSEDELQQAADESRVTGVAGLREQRRRGRSSMVSRQQVLLKLYSEQWAGSRLWVTGLWPLRLASQLTEPALLHCSAGRLRVLLQL